MYRLFALLALTVLLTGGLGSVARSTSAAPAQTYNTSECFDFGFLFCVQNKGAIKENASQSGITTFVDNGSSCYQVYRNGVLEEQACSKLHNIFVVKDGQDHVSHNTFREESAFLLDGVQYTCATSYHYVYVNGEYRREDSQRTCTPPLEEPEEPA